MAHSDPIPPARARSRAHRGRRYWAESCPPVPTAIYRGIHAQDMLISRMLKDASLMMIWRNDKVDGPLAALGSAAPVIANQNSDRVKLVREDA
jgi:hypothetical protein